MIFKPAEPDENYSVVKLESEQWEMGLTQFMFGQRVRVSRKGAQVCPVDYCAGPEPAFQQELLSMVRAILEPVPESLGTEEMFNMFPTHTVKPINLDEECMEQLRELVGKARKVCA